MSRISANDVNRADLSDAITLYHSHNRRMSAKQLMDIYPRKDKAAHPKTYDFGSIVAQIGEEYGDEARKLACIVLSEDSSLIPALLYLHAHWPAGELDIKAPYSRKAEYFGINQKTFERFCRNEGIKMKLENLWKLIIGMRLTPEQSQEFLTLCANQRSDMDCALMVCLDVWGREKEYPDHETINQYLKDHFGSSADSFLYEE